MPELRKDPITGRWVIISTERGRRPIDFLRDSVIINGQKNCPFCPGAEAKTPPEILVYGRNGGASAPPAWRSGVEGKIRFGWTTVVGRKLRKTGVS